MRRISLCLVALVLSTLPAAQAAPVPACGAKAVGASPFENLEGVLGYKPLEPGERLFYGLAGLGQGAPLEVRYLVEGEVYLAEIVDLANARPPRLNLDEEKPSLKSMTALGAEDLPGKEKVFELLALRPDLVRQLRQLAGEGAAIRIEVHQDGRMTESLSYQDLRRRSAELAESDALSLAVKSTVSGPGDRGGDKIRSAVAFDYLENCADCTWSTPCDTECGWDPGKGGPVTCGEYGVCDSNPTCSCSSVVSEWWTGWYLVRSYFNGQAACFYSYTVPPPSGAVHYRYVEEYRRDRIRRSYVCPNCPSCDNCYYDEQVIAYELGYAACWQEAPPFCQNPSMPSCNSLCFVGPFTPCY